MKPGSMMQEHKPAAISHIMRSYQSILRLSRIYKKDDEVVAKQIHDEIALLEKSFSDLRKLIDRKSNIAASNLAGRLLLNLYVFDRPEHPIIHEGFQNIWSLSSTRNRFIRLIQVDITAAVATDNPETLELKLNRLDHIIQKIDHPESNALLFDMVSPYLKLAKLRQDNGIMQYIYEHCKVLPDKEDRLPYWIFEEAKTVFDSLTKILMQYIAGDGNKKETNDKDRYRQVKTILDKLIELSIDDKPDVNYRWADELIITILNVLAEINNEFSNCCRLATKLCQFLEHWFSWFSDPREEDKYICDNLGVSCNSKVAAKSNWKGDPWRGFKVRGFKNGTRLERLHHSYLSRPPCVKLQSPVDQFNREGIFDWLDKTRALIGKKDFEQQTVLKNIIGEQNPFDRVVSLCVPNLQSFDESPKVQYGQSYTPTYESHRFRVQGEPVPSDVYAIYSAIIDKIRRAQTLEAKIREAIVTAEFRLPIPNDLYEHLCGLNPRFATLIDENAVKPEYQHQVASAAATSSASDAEEEVIW